MMLIISFISLPVATSQTKLPVDTTTETLTSMSTKTSVSGITDIGTQSTGSPSTPTPVSRFESVHEILVLILHMSSDTYFIV